jgi:hypothetical protein
MTEHNAGDAAISQLWNALCTSMKAQTPWYDIPLQRENYQLPQYVDYNLFPVNIYEYHLHSMLMFK